VKKKCIQGSSLLSLAFPRYVAAIDLNILSDLKVHKVIDWSSIDQWDWTAYELDYDLVWNDDGYEGAIHFFILFDSYVFLRKLISISLACISSR
jgi:hypothetical protein